MFSWSVPLPSEEWLPPLPMTNWAVFRLAGDSLALALDLRMGMGEGASCVWDRYLEVCPNWKPRTMLCSLVAEPALVSEEAAGDMRMPSVLAEPMVEAEESMGMVSWGRL